MKIELKNVKYMASLSEETMCFSATVYIDGKKRGEVKNRGCGGAHDYHPFELEGEIEAHAATLPPYKSSYSEEPRPMCAEILVNEILAKELELRDLRRAARNKTLFKIPGHNYGDGGYHSLNLPYSEKAVTYLLKKYGSGVEILNSKFMEAT